MNRLVLPAAIAVAALFAATSPATAKDPYPKPKKLHEHYLHESWKIHEAPPAAGKFVYFTVTTGVNGVPMLLTTDSTTKDVDEDLLKTFLMHPKDGNRVEGTFTYTKKDGWTFTITKEVLGTDVQRIDEIALKSGFAGFMVKPALDICLLEPALKKELFAIADKKFETENFNFVVDADAFLLEPSAKGWKDMYAKYFETGVEQELNLSGGTKKALEALKDSKKPEKDPKVLKAVGDTRSEIRASIMRNDAWAEFRKKEHGEVTKRIKIDDKRNDKK